MNTYELIARYYCLPFCHTHRHSTYLAALRTKLLIVVDDFVNATLTVT
jgi:hypothetical protein